MYRPGWEASLRGDQLTITGVQALQMCLGLEEPAAAVPNQLAARVRSLTLNLISAREFAPHSKRLAARFPALAVDANVSALIAHALIAHTGCIAFTTNTGTTHSD